MNKKFCSVLSGLVFVGISATATAGKPTEAEIFHCGCVAIDEGMELARSEMQWSNIIVNGKSRGHRNHEAGDIEICVTEDQFGNEVEDELERGFSDCEITGNLLGVSACPDDWAVSHGDSCAPL